MTLKTAFPAPTGVGLSSPDNRADLAGLIVRSSSGVPRAGVFLRNWDPIVTARASMGVNVTGFDAVLVRNGLPQLSNNDGVTTVPIGAAPGANFRYDIVYAKQNESASPFSDANNNPILGYVSGTASATPDLAAAIALVPAGGLALAAVLIPSTATTTQSAGVVITQLHPFTTTAGGVLPFRSTTERDAFAAASGQLARVGANGGLDTFNGTSWDTDIEETADIATFQASWGPTNTNSHKPRVKKRGTLVTMMGGLTSTASHNGVGVFTVPVGFRPTIAGTRFAGLVITNTGRVTAATISDSGVLNIGGGSYDSGTGNFASGTVVVLAGLSWYTN